MNTVTIWTTDCHKCENESIVSVHTLTGAAKCTKCESTWIYGATELLEILTNLED